MRVQFAVATILSVLLAQCHAGPVRRMARGMGVAALVATDAFFTPTTRTARFGVGPVAVSDVGHEHSLHRHAHTVPPPLRDSFPILPDVSSAVDVDFEEVHVRSAEKNFDTNVTPGGLVPEFDPVRGKGRLTPLKNAWWGAMCKLGLGAPRNTDVEQQVGDNVNELNDFDVYGPDELDDDFDEAKEQFVASQYGATGVVDAVMLQNFAKWVATSLLTYFSEEATKGALQAEANLAFTELDLKLPYIYATEGELMARGYEWMPAPLKPVYAVLLRANRQFRHLARALRESIMTALSVTLTEQTNLVVAKIIVEHAKENARLPTMMEALDVDLYLTNFFIDIHPKIMADLEENGMDQIMQALAARCAKSAFDAVQAFFLRAGIHPPSASAPVAVDVEALEADEMDETMSNEKNAVARIAKRLSKRTVKTAKSIGPTLKSMGTEVAQSVDNGLAVSASEIVKNLLLGTTSLAKDLLMASIEKNILRAMSVFKLKRIPTAVCWANAGLTKYNLWGGASCHAGLAEECDEKVRARKNREVERLNTGAKI